MNSVLTPPRRPSIRLAGAVIAVLGLAVALAALFPIARLAQSERPPSRRLTVENPTAYDVNIDVTGSDRDRWLEVGYFRREARRTVEELADQGPEWVFRFSYGGADAGELVVSREQLAKDGWKIAVPPEVGERLRAAGLSESAR